ncbi:hypothetical protein SAMN05443377_10856 [Propionibacterium cyclohexanicum]|uniref:Uncharacterized protein n=1 Tax=Propionibacterium cyclohexanicum TaxID=64702 RepID=A0A1H9RNZ7_9ACTN|nr:hypothetical protein SAMN05443377_10856 [Propionibacterium cyclohexanicum]
MPIPTESGGDARFDQRGQQMCTDAMASGETARSALMTPRLASPSAPGPDAQAMDLLWDDAMSQTAERPGLGCLPLGGRDVCR